MSTTFGIWYLFLTTWWCQSSGRLKPTDFYKLKIPRLNLPLIVMSWKKEGPQHAGTQIGSLVFGDLRASNLTSELQTFSYRWNKNSGFSIGKGIDLVILKKSMFWAQACRGPFVLVTGTVNDYAPPHTDHSKAGLFVSNDAWSGSQWSYMFGGLNVFQCVSLCFHI